ncbi:4Fe-4S binding protein [Alicyclobacillus hesperidum]|uniref:4Fe-4S binding protein n=1 Tax=Alicyclobacillus hesperidum TaxID=89784 RepID=UPI0009DA78A4
MPVTDTLCFGRTVEKQRISSYNSGKGDFEFRGEGHGIRGHGDRSWCLWYCPLGSLVELVQQLLSHKTSRSIHLD